ncbi:pollen-specific leucine-rich repeat extensin-like protein 2 [Lactuca sativa]|uniref:pollen-specific leucine-rich repeat extensin-like protein 2 n=1 Tax=Lactuca sativa TaxID=4236 RepID=UPI0022AF6091|nr:pollen-specific leucine-rich repeat extensin-like protein 2 [Lactuca sativa]
MARRSKSPTPPSSENDKADEEVKSHHKSPRGNTRPRSPTPTEPIHDKIPTLPPSPKQTISVSVPIDPPPTTSQPTTSLPPPPPVTSTPISTTHLPPPIISQTTTTTIPELTVEVNVSDTGATTVTKTPIIHKPLSPTHSTDSGATLGGENDEYDSTYFSPYRLPTDDDADAPITTQHLQNINEKLDRLLEDSKAYSGEVLKAFLETALEQYTESIEKSTKAIFLESLKGHADTNAAKVQAYVDSLSKSLQEESTRFEAVRSSIQKENTSLLSSVSSRLEYLHADLAKESALKEQLACQSTQCEVLKVQLAHAEK